MAPSSTRFDDLIAQTERKIAAQRARLEGCPSDGAVADVIRRGLAMLRSDLDTYRAMRSAMEGVRRVMEATEGISPSEDPNRDAAGLTDPLNRTGPIPTLAELSVGPGGPIERPAPCPIPPRSR